MRKTIGKCIFDSAKATIIAESPSTLNKHGKAHVLMRSPKGRYFVYSESLWDGEPREDIEPIELERAIELYSEYTQIVPPEEAFPGVQFEEV